MRALQNCEIIRAKIIPLHSVVVRGGVTWKYLDVVFRWGLETSASQTNLTQIFSPFSSCWPSSKQGSDLLDWIGFQIGLDCGSDQTVISTFTVLVQKNSYEN